MEGHEVTEKEISSRTFWTIDVFNCAIVALNIVLNLLMAHQHQEYIDFYNHHTNDPQIKEVVEKCMRLNYGEPEFNARRMMLQGKRMVVISNA